MVPFGSGEQHRGFENGVLRDGHRLDQAFLHQEAEQGSGPVVAQTAGVDAGRHEVVAQGVHH